MENFYTLWGFGFVILTIVLLVFVCGIFGYKFLFTSNENDKKLEVTPIKTNSKLNKK